MKRQSKDLTLGFFGGIDLEPFADRIDEELYG
jgi:hypothetical protein